MERRSMSPDDYRSRCQIAELERWHSDAMPLRLTVNGESYDTHYTAMMSGPAPAALMERTARLDWIPVSSPSGAVRVHRRQPHRVH